MSEYEPPEENRQRMLEEVNRKLREAGEDAAEYIRTPGLGSGFGNLLNDLVKDPYGGQRPYEPPRITKHEELGQVAFSSSEDNSN